MCVDNIPKWVNHISALDQISDDSVKNHVKIRYQQE